MDKTNTGTESPQSATSTFYYKGHCILLTTRDGAIDALPLLEKHIALIEAVSGKYPEIKPSWNVQTNHELAKDSDPIKDWPATPRSEVKREYTEDGYKAKQESCFHGRVTTKVSHSEKNPNRAFSACADCGKFIAWAAGS